VRGHDGIQRFRLARLRDDERAAGSADRRCGGEKGGAQDCDEQRCFRCGLHHAETTESVLDPQTRGRDRMRPGGVVVSRAGSTGCWCQRTREESARNCARVPFWTIAIRTSHRNILFDQMLTVAAALW